MAHFPGGAFRQRVVAHLIAPHCFLLLVNMHSSLPLHVEFMMVQLAAAARSVSVATTETTARETIHELVLKYLSPLNDSPFHQPADQ